MPKLLSTLFVSIAIAVLTLPALAQLGSDIPSDTTLLMQRAKEGGSSASGIFDVALPHRHPEQSQVSAIADIMLSVRSPTL